MKITWMKLNKNYWEERYRENKLGWDIGAVSTPIKAYIDQLKDNSLKILIPGAGKGYEAQYAHQRGFRNTYVVDIASQPLKHIKLASPDFPSAHLLETDFFEIEESDFDLVLEQTFFCALTPELRMPYVEKMYEILKPGGILAGLFFDFPMTDSGPPFGGSIEEYQSLFQERFKIHKLERAYNSIPPRKGNELFFIFEK